MHNSSRILSGIGSTHTRTPMFSLSTRLLSVLLLLALTSCSQSLVYSPALHLSERQLQAQQVELKASVGMLPETRPLENLDKATLGTTIELGYGFTDAFNLALSGWKAWIYKRDSDGTFTFKSGENAIATYAANRGGLALSSRISLNTNSEYNIVLYPRAALLLDENEINGYGFAIPIVVLKPFSKAVYSYAGVGIAYGIKKFGNESNSQGKSVLPHGYGIIGHIGIGWNIIDQLRLTGEVNPVYQLNSFDNTNNAVVVPSISVGYIPSW